MNAYTYSCFAILYSDRPKLSSQRPKPIFFVKFLVDTELIQILCERNDAFGIFERSAEYIYSR